MKNVLFAFCFLCFFNTVHSQEGFVQVKYRKEVLQRTLCVVLDDKQEDPYFERLTTVMAIYWKITPYKFITESAYLKMSREEKTKYAFLYFTTIFSVTADGSTTHGEELGRIVDNSEASSKSVIYPVIIYYPDKNTCTEVCRGIFAYRAVEKYSSNKIKLDESQCDSPELVKILLRYMQAAIKPNYPHDKQKKMQLYLNLGKKTLVIPQSALDKDFAEADVKAEYPYPFKIISDEELKTYIDEDADDIAYLIMEKETGEKKSGHSNNRMKYIFEAKTGELLFADETTPALNKKCLSRIKAGK